MTLNSHPKIYGFCDTLNEVRFGSYVSITVV